MIGTPVVYASESRSLAALEVLVHYDVIPRDFVLTEIRIGDDVTVEVLDRQAAPEGWDSEIVSPVTQEIGERWVKAGNSAILSVPSTIVPTERNFVINPAHSLFLRIEFLPSVPFVFDPRLK